jgi:hypothetical protein
MLPFRTCHASGVRATCRHNLRYYQSEQLSHFHALAHGRLRPSSAFALVSSGKNRLQTLNVDLRRTAGVCSTKGCARWAPIGNGRPKPTG